MAITNFAKACPKQFVVYLKDVFGSFEMLWGYVHDNVNLELIVAYEALLICMNEAEGAINNLEGMQAHDETLAKKAWAGDIFPKFEKIIEESDLKEEVAKVLESIYGIIDHFGAELFRNNNTLDRIMVLSKSLLEYKAVCQTKNEDEDDEDIDHDEQILGGIVDLFLIISEKLGNDFHTYFTQVFTCLKKYLSPQRSESDRSMVFGCMADILKNSKTSVKFYISLLFGSIEENMKRNMKKKHDDLFRHMAYLLGILFDSDPETSKEYFNSTMNYLQTIFENGGKTSKDNVIAAISRITVALNLNQSNELYGKIIDTVLSNSPLQNDPFENPTLLKFVIYLSDKMDITTFGLYFDKIMGILKILVLNEIKCGTSKQIFKDIKSYLELLNNNEIIKGYIENYVAVNLNDQERDRFVNSIRNA